MDKHHGLVEYRLGTEQQWFRGFRNLTQIGCKKMAGGMGVQWLTRGNLIQRMCVIHQGWNLIKITLMIIAIKMLGVLVFIIAILTGTHSWVLTHAHGMQWALKVMA